MKDEPASIWPGSKVPFSRAWPLAIRTSASVEAPPRLSSCDAVPEAACAMRPETASTVLAVIARITWGNTASITALGSPATAAGAAVP